MTPNVPESKQQEDMNFYRQCDGTIVNGFCNKCYDPAQSTSNYCGRLIPPPVIASASTSQTEPEPVPEKTAEEMLMWLTGLSKDSLNAAGDSFEGKPQHLFNKDQVISFMQEYAQQFKGQSTGYNQGPEAARKEAEEVFGGLRELIKDDSIYQWYLELIIQWRIGAK